MDIVKIAFIGLAGTILALTLNDGRSFGFMASAAVGMVMLFLFIPSVADIFSEFLDIGKSTGIDGKYISVMLKALVTAYISMFSSQLCRDFGQNSIADKIELGGKIIILLNAVTVIDELIDELMRIMV